SGVCNRVGSLCRGGTYSGDVRNPGASPAHFGGESFDSVTARAEVPFLQHAPPCLAALCSSAACWYSVFLALWRRSLALGILRRWCRREPRLSTSVVSA